jgi:hypothetical protein
MQRGVMTLRYVAWRRVKVAWRREKRRDFRHVSNALKKQSSKNSFTKELPSKMPSKMKITN